MSHPSETQSPAPPPASPANAETPIGPMPPAPTPTAGEAASITHKPPSPNPPPTATATPLAIHAWRKLRREPSLMFTAAYVFVSFIGLWANYWFYRGFHLPILEYMQATDYLVAGLRDPAYGLILLAALLFVLVITWPDAWRRKHPARVEALRRRWWGRWVFPNNPLLRWAGVGMSPETGVAVATIFATAWGASSYVRDKAGDIRDHGGGHRVQVTLTGDAAPQPGDARLLGTSSAFVFLWWPQQHRVEAVPIESIGRLQTLPMRPPRKATPAPAPQAGPAAPAAAQARQP